MTMKRPLDCSDAVFFTSMNKTTLVGSNLTYTVRIFSHFYFLSELQNYDYGFNGYGWEA